MQISDLLHQSGGIAAMARELGLTPQQAEAGAVALAPAVLGGLTKQAGSLEGLGGLLGQLGGGGLLDNVLRPQPTDTGLGNNVLGQIFGSPDVSRTVAQQASATSGLDAGVLKKMLPLLAMLLAGMLARQHGQAQAGAAAQAGPGEASPGGLGGALGGMLGGLLGGGAQPGAAATPGSAPAAKGGLGGLIGMLDFDGDGNPLDDILGMVTGRGNAR